jgi:hypothetical protein
MTIGTAGVLRRRSVGCATLALLFAAGSCATQVRVPLAVPLPAVGGSRPATPQGVGLITTFGDGVWGQEQLRAEMWGLGIGASGWDRVEIDVASHRSTRRVRDMEGGIHSGEATSLLRGKLRIADFLRGRASVGVHVALLTSDRQRSDVQNESLTAFDLAVPVEFSPLGGGGVDHALGIYAGPRLVHQTFTDHTAMRTTRGTLTGGFLGLVARWGWLSLNGELNTMHRPDMMPVGGSPGGGWILLPAGSLRVMLPLGG